MADPKQDDQPPTERGDEARTRWVVLKFGGTSVSSLERWETIRSVLEDCRREGTRPVMVCSALSQVSNRLEELLARALEGEKPESGLAGLRDVHRGLANAMGLDADELLTEAFEDLERTLLGITLTREETPRLRARVLSTGELLSTRLGVAWLAKAGMRAEWQDARDLLTAQLERPSALAEQRQYLSAACSHEADPELAARLAGLDADVIVTQGFIARGPEGDTVLLGRGGSDTSAAYLAARLSAERLEIWTDVPGLFTANPGWVPEARLLRRLGYDEASELASRGAKVLHPRCLRPLRRQGIPLRIRCTPWPDAEGTEISDRPHPDLQGILGLAARQGLVIVNLDLEGTWQRVGVIAEIAGAFRDLGLSIDLLSSSQTHVTLVLDPSANQLGEPVLRALARELASVAEPHFLQDTASVSLVGTSIADVLHELGPVLENLENENVHLVSHGANDRSLTVVVDRESVERLVRTIHGKLFEARASAPVFGPTWEEIRDRAEGGA